MSVTVTVCLFADPNPHEGLDFFALRCWFPMELRMEAVMGPGEFSPYVAFSCSEEMKICGWRGMGVRVGWERRRVRTRCVERERK